MEFLDYFVRNRITIEPFLTKKCNFKCGFCMYDCSSKSSDEFISDEMLSKLKKQVDFLQALNIPVTINLLGGEPTLFFDKLKHVVDIVSTWNVCITMPTNGWWLERNSSTEKFMGIFKDLVVNGNCFDSNNGHGLGIRISDEKYHQTWRRGNNNKEHFTEIFYDPKYSHLRPDEKYPWIQWQTLNPNYLINPHGRGANISNMKEQLSIKENVPWRFCTQEYNNMTLESIHYELNGDISSTCQFGNEHSIGTIDDNILYIILLSQEYNKYRHNLDGYNCYNCTEMFNSWLENKSDRAKDKLSAMNTFDLKLWKMLKHHEIGIL
jgi:organic radical activating enzyme